MKNLILLSLLAVAAPVTARAQAELPLDEVAPAPKSAVTLDAFVWRVQPPVGSRWTMRSFSRATSTTQVPPNSADSDAKSPQKMEFVFIQKMTADYEILSRDAYGATTIRLTFRDMSLDMTSFFNGKKEVLPAAAAPSKKSVDGATLTLKQAPDGRVWNVMGARAFQRRLLEASGISDPAQIEEALKMTDAMGGAKMLKSLSLMSSQLPGPPIRVGESWDYSVDLPAQMPLSLAITGTRTLKKLDTDFAYIADSAQLNGGNSALDLPPMEQNGAIKMDFGKLTGVVSGTSRVERSSGLTLETTIHQTMSGSVSTKLFDAQGALKTSQTIPLDVKSTARVVLEPR